MEYFHAVISLMFILLASFWCSNNIRTVAEWGLLQKPLVSLESRQTIMSINMYFYLLTNCRERQTHKGTRQIFCIHFICNSFQIVFLPRILLNLKIEKKKKEKTKREREREKHRCRVQSKLKKKKSLKLIKNLNMYNFFF